MTIRELIDRLVGMDRAEAEVRIRIFLPEQNALADWPIDDIPTPQKSWDDIFIEARVDKSDLDELTEEDPNA